MFEGLDTFVLLVVVNKACCEVSTGFCNWWGTLYRDAGQAFAGLPSM